MTSHNTKKKIAIALQGGGSWGAFAWGVLDRLLEDPDIEITDICGTSAGALNGSIVSYAINSAKDYKSGAAQARVDLRRFWEAVSDKNSELMQLLAVLNGKSPLAFFRDPVKDPNLPALKWLQNGKAIAEANPFLKYSGLTDTFNHAAEGTATKKLRRMIRDFIPSYDVIREGKRLKLHVNAAELTPQGLVNNNFSGQSLSLNAVMASATLKGLFEPVEIDGKKYFDGAYTQNPPVDSLYGQNDRARQFDDILWVMSNPPKDHIRARHQDQISAKDLEESAGLVLHHAYDHVAHIINQPNYDKTKPYSHLIYFDAPLHYDQTSKQNTESAFLHYLFEEGRKEAERFLSRHKGDLGARSTLNIESIRKQARKHTASILWPK